MATQLKSKQTSKGERLGWAPLKEVKSVELTPELLKGKKFSHDRSGDDNLLANSYLIP